MPPKTRPAPAPRRPNRSPWAVRRVLAAVGLALLAACSGAPVSRAPLVDGRGIYTLRYNPPACLVGRPELHFEVQTPQGWERVALETPEEGEDDLVAELTTRSETAPDAPVQVEATFTPNVLAWSGRHQSRVVRLIALDVEAPVEQ